MKSLPIWANEDFDLDDRDGLMYVHGHEGGAKEDELVIVEEVVDEMVMKRVRKCVEHRVGQSPGNLLG